jgi:hypothetical protein
MIERSAIVVNSVEPHEGREGTIVTLRGSGFPTNIRNNCVVMGGMGACARAQPHPTPTELKVRIGPVARKTEGDILMWPGVGFDLHMERVDLARTSLRFSEVAMFRNAAPVTNAKVNFRLTEVSPNTYAGHFEKSGAPGAELGGHEAGSVMRVSFPNELRLPRNPTVDICVVLKEPTLAIDFTARIAGGNESAGEGLKAIAKAITVNAAQIGEKVFADVGRNEKTGELELYVTKPYLQNGMIVVHFNSHKAS